MLRTMPPRMRPLIMTFDPRTRNKALYSRDVLALNPHLLGAQSSQDDRQRVFSSKTGQQTSRPKKSKKQRCPNKTETAFQNMLVARLNAGEFSGVAFEPFSLPLEGGYKYVPDFVAIPAGQRFSISDLTRLSQTTAMAVASSEEFAKLVDTFWAWVKSGWRFITLAIPWASPNA